MKKFALRPLSGLSCYSCSSDAVGEICINDPSAVQSGTTPCYNPYDEYCYTYRLEEGESKYASA